MKLLPMLVSFLLIVQSCWADDKEVEAVGIKVKVLGKSGKVLVRKKTNDENESVIILMDEISEYVADGITKVSKHTFNTFANQKFIFTALKDKQYQNISTKSFNFKANIIGAKLTVSVTIFEEAGFIQNDDEEIEVKKGMVKTDILISNWNFCDPCKMGNRTETFGTKLQFTMTIKGKNAAPKKKSAKKARKVGHKRAPSYDLGENVILILSKKYKDDEEWKDMEAGYPKMVTKGSKTSFVFRFEKFNNTVFYDPSVDLSESDDGDSSGEIVKFSVVLVVFALFINLIDSIF